MSGFGEWIPIESGCEMPEQDQRVLVTKGGVGKTDRLSLGIGYPDAFLVDGGWFHRSGYGYRNGFGRSILAWMPAPPLWKRGE